MSPAADDFAIALDRCGWMIVQQPQFGDRRWFMNYPSDACPEWADNDVPGEPPRPRPRLRVIDGGNPARIVSALDRKPSVNDLPPAVVQMSKTMTSRPHS